MGKKGSNKTTYNERPQSAEEKQLLNTQTQQLNEAIKIARQQDDRSQEQYDQWKNAYAPIETGMIMQGATRENGYSDPRMIAGSDKRNLLFKSRQDEQNRYGGGMYHSRGGEAPVAYQSYQSSGKGR